MKFDMGADTLSTLTQQSGGAHEDVGALLRRLAGAVAPLEGRFNGAGRVAFDAFAARSDEVAAELNGALGSIIAGQQGMNRSFESGDTDMADNVRTAQGSANFDSARFGARA